MDLLMISIEWPLNTSLTVPAVSNLSVKIFKNVQLHVATRG